MSCELVNNCILHSVIIVFMTCFPENKFFSGNLRVIYIKLYVMDLETVVFSTYFL